MSVTTPMRLVLDTNVVVAAFRSPNGASAALLNAVRQGEATMVANPALFLEYEAVLKRPQHLAAAGLGLDEVDSALTALALILSPAPGAASRPLLRDADDEMVLEAAINVRGRHVRPARRRLRHRSADAWSGMA